MKNTNPPTNWEATLVSLAQEALRPARARVTPKDVEPARLQEAYAYCEAQTAIHSKSFYTASQLLPAAKRQAIRALYMFCRVTDDIVDLTDKAEAANALMLWKSETAENNPQRTHLVALAWQDTCAHYHIPQRCVEHFIHGVELDLQPKPYTNFAELAFYCYGVASTVGLLSMHIIGYADDDALPYAVKLGVALQLTNILRDVGEDARNGRLYLPQDELSFFGVTEAEVFAGKVTENWRAFIRYQIQRNRQLYEESQPGIALLAPEGQLAIAAAADFYSGILNDIEAHDYDVFTRRARVSGWGKIRRLPQLWWNYGHTPRWPRSRPQAEALGNPAPHEV